MRWEIIKMDIEEGGLNIDESILLNNTLGEKLVWRLLKEDNSSWDQAMS